MADTPQPPPTPPSPASAKPARHSFQAPTGTRDFYPIELARRRFIEAAWRKVAIRHGFEEIDGPTFEHLDLYTVKSGEGIVSELFSFTRAGGEKTYALRPEFTPTLARMYAAKAGGLPKPTKWFWQSTCFRAERPQRGRLREFMQWNCDVMGGENTLLGDVEIVSCCIEVLRELGLTPNDVVIGYSNREYIAQILRETYNISSDNIEPMRKLFDEGQKIDPKAFDQKAMALGIAQDKIEFFSTFAGVRPLKGKGRWTNESPLLAPFQGELKSAGIDEWCDFRPSIVRGLAYYTGMVFEVHEATGAERAIAGGGRYDNLIELFGGPATPAVGFGMGDVVLSLVLQDKGLMPSDRDIARSLGLRPDVFVLTNGTPETEALLAPLLARLRREGKHARRSYKATKNIGKLLKEAADADARYAVILESPTEVTLKNMDDGTQTKGPAEEMLALIRPS